MRVIVVAKANILTNTDKSPLDSHKAHPTERMQWYSRLHRINTGALQQENKLELHQVGRAITTESRRTPGPFGNHEIWQG